MKISVEKILSVKKQMIILQIAFHGINPFSLFDKPIELP
jgi:hypothetical protein